MNSPFSNSRGVWQTVARRRMGKKPLKRGAELKRDTSPPSESPLDPLIEPSILKIADLLKSGRLTPEEMAKPIAGSGWARVPPELRPFLESPTVQKLAEVVRTFPGLYWHPLVMRQVTYLRGLRHDENEWERLGWEPEWDDTYGIQRPPKEVAAVSESLSQLLEAHASGLFPHRRIVWRDKARRPGRKGRLKNPHPTGEPWTQWVEAARLDEDFRHLRSAFKARLKEAKGKPHWRNKAKEWYRNLCQRVLEEASTTAGVGWWSGWKEYQAEPEPEPTSGPSPAGSLNELLARPVTVVVEQWKPLNLDSALDKMGGDTKPVSLTKEGEAAYLAYAVLGALLAAPPEKIRNTIANYRRSRQS